MTRTKFALLTLAFPACAASSTTSSSTSAITSAVPKAEWIDIQAAYDQPVVTESSPAPLPATCQGGPPAMFAQMAAQVMGGGNGPVQGVLGLVTQVSQTPPTVLLPDHAVWALASPGDPLVHRLDIQRVAPDTYHFLLSGKAAAAGDDAWIGLFQGDINSPDADHAQGDVEIDLGAIHSLDSNSRPASGGILIHFASAPEGRGIDETFANIVDPASPQPNDAHYAFAQDSTGVAFDFQTLVDFDHDGTQNERVEVQARFLSDGEGKASTTVSGGNLGSASVGAIECWDNQQRVLFYGDDMNANPPAGDPGCCIM